MPDTIADGLRHTSPASLLWEVNKVLLDDVVTVTDDCIAHAMRWAFEHLKIVVEPSVAAALASAGIPPGQAGVVISGGLVHYPTFQAITAGWPETAYGGHPPADDPNWPDSGAPDQQLYGR